MEQVRFDHLGVFTYSDAEDLPSHQFPGHVPQKVAISRYDTLMSRQMEISTEKLSGLIEKKLPVLIESSSEPYLYEGRSPLQAPEVDGITFVRTRPNSPEITVGQRVTTKITETLEYDLVGEAL